MTTPREAVYDEHIYPLIAKITRICLAHDIGIHASFDLSDQKTLDNVACTTHIPAKNDGNLGWRVLYDNITRLIITGQDRKAT